MKIPLILVLELILLGSSYGQPGFFLTTDPDARYTDADTLRSGEGLCSEDGTGVLIISNYGNLQLYDISGAPDHIRMIWSAGVLTTAVRSLRLNNDGELIFFEDTGTVVWQSHFHGPTNTDYFAYIVSTGDFVVTNEEGLIVWNLGTFFFDSTEVIPRELQKNFRVTVPTGWPHVVHNMKDEDNRRRGCVGWNPY